MVLAEGRPAGQAGLHDYISKAGSGKDNLRGLIHWEKPMIKPGPTGDEIAIPGAPL